MSFLNTLSVFYYGTKITKDNTFINFSEGGPELSAQLTPSDYTLEEIAAAIADQMNLVGGQVYTVTVNRDTRKITISAPSTFNLLTQTGSQSGNSIWQIIGFSQVADKTGANSYVGDLGAGSEYRPQLVLGEYIQPEDYQISESAVVNVSVSGEVQALQFGEGQRMQCNLRGITNLTGLRQTLFFENAQGIADARTFLKYLITKAKVEFMPDQSSRAVFYKVLLDATEADRSGTRFVIKNMEGANFFYETGTLTFRRVFT